MITGPNLERIRAQIEKCSDPKLLKQWIRNASTQKNEAIVRAARLRLFAVLPSADPGSFEHEVWASIYALEELESSERGKTIRLQRTRNLIRDVGEEECVRRLLLKPTASSGYDMLLRHGLPDLLFEAIALRHSSRFGSDALERAKNRMEAARDHRVGTGSGPE